MNNIKINKLWVKIRRFYNIREQAPLKFSSTEGLIYPFLDWFFYILRCFSPLIYIQKVKRWQTSRMVIDVYVLIWFISSCITVLILYFLYENNDPPINNYLPLAVKYFLVCIFSLRLIDIVQSWWHIAFVPKLEAKAPRVVILVLINYIEIALIFAIIGHLSHLWPYYGIEPLNNLQIMDSLRVSFATLTPFGIFYEPRSITKALLLYFEYIIGLFFLVVIINVVISYLTIIIEKTKTK